MTQFVYVDSAVWITSIEGQQDHKKIIRQHLGSLDKIIWTFCTSDAVILEVLCKPLQQKNFNLIGIYNNSLQSNFLLPIFPEVFKDALTISALEKLHPLDSIHIAIALH